MDKKLMLTASLVMAGCVAAYAAYRALSASPLGLLVVVVFGVAVLGALAKQQGLGSFKYRALRVMTENEVEFFGRLRNAVPELHVFPQVAMSALIAPAGLSGKTRLAAFRAVSQKRVDYALFTRHMELVCVVELDDRTHNKDKDMVRDGHLASAGIKTLRWESRAKPAEGVIRAAVQAVANSQQQGRAQ